MPPPPARPTTFVEILQQVWWRLDAALDLEMLRWSALLGATEALMGGTTAIVDHHESPDRHRGLPVRHRRRLRRGRGPRAHRVRRDRPLGRPGPAAGRRLAAPKMTDAARRGLAENERFLRDGGRGMVGVHAAFTCSDDTLAAAAGLAADLGVGVHVHVAEGIVDRDAGARLADLARDDWLLVHCVHLDRDLPGTIAHNPRSQHEQRGRLRPTRRPAEPGRPRHRRDRRRHARGGPPGLRPPARGRRRGDGRRAVGVAGRRAALVPRGAPTTG